MSCSFSFPRVLLCNIIFLTVSPNFSSRHQTSYHLFKIHWERTIFWWLGQFYTKTKLENCFASQVQFGIICPKRTQSPWQRESPKAFHLVLCPILPSPRQCPPFITRDWHSVQTGISLCKLPAQVPAHFFLLYVTL